MIFSSIQRLVSKTDATRSECRITKLSNNLQIEHLAHARRYTAQGWRVSMSENTLCTLLPASRIQRRFQFTEGNLPTIPSNLTSSPLAPSLSQPDLQDL